MGITKNQLIVMGYDELISFNRIREKMLVIAGHPTTPPSFLIHKRLGLQISVDSQ